MTPSKRLFDIVMALILSVIFLPVLLVIAVVVLVTSGKPVFYISERMNGPEQAFLLYKVRTMKTVAHDSGVSGGDKSDRITKVGAFLRKTRLDELPQLWNVLRGDISFVGPRPPLRQYVERFPDLYREVLRSRPGITGMASVYFHKHEERILARARSVEETDALYTRMCIPRKAHLDLIYQRNQSLCLDLKLLFVSAFKTWL